MDADGSGSVDFEEFLDLMKSKTKESQEEAEVKEAFRILDREDKGTNCNGIFQSHSSNA